MSQPVLSIRQLAKQREIASGLLTQVITPDAKLGVTISLSPAQTAIVLERYIELIDLASAKVEEFRVLKDKFERMASCR